MSDEKNNIIDAIKIVFDDDKLNKEFDDINPFKQVSTSNILGSHVSEFMKQKQQHKKGVNNG